MERDGLERVTRAFPCKICGKPDYCTRLRRFHWCMRVEGGKPHPKGGWLHPRGEIETQNLPPPQPRPRRVSDLELADMWSPVAEKCARHGFETLPRLAEQLGVSISSLLLLGVGYSDDLQGTACWTFPERNTQGWIVGLSRRLVSPKDGKSKLSCKGARRGLSYMPGWDQSPGVIWLVEGGSDTAAALTLGLCVIGRPSNTGGVDMLARMLRKHRDRRIIVLGENDRKSPLAVSQANPKHNPKCRCCLQCFPGKAGAKQTALELAKRLHRTVAWMMPPEGIKDLREFVKTIKPQDREGYGSAFKAGRFPTARS